MITVEIPSRAFEDVGFRPEAEVRHTLAPGTAPPLLEKLSITPPVVVALTPEQAADDPRVVEHLRERANELRYSLVHFKIGFAPAPGEPIVAAVVEVTLVSNIGETHAIVTGMDPDKMADMNDVRRDLEGKVEVEYAGGKLAFSAKRGVERAAGDLFLVAAGIGQSRAGWEITETPSVRIGGVLVFNLILQSGTRSPATGRVGVTAQVRRNRFGLIPYRARLDETPTGAFAL